MYGCGVFIFRLGARHGTKSKREQTASLDPTKHPEVAGILSLLLEVLGPDDRLVPYSYQTYLNALLGVTQHLGIDAHVTPHGARAGFATERIAAGEDPTAVRTAGRWESESSFKTYIDVVMASQVSIMIALSGHRKIMEYTFTHLHLYFSSELFRSERHARARHSEVPAHGKVCTPCPGLLGREEASKRKEASGRHSRSTTGKLNDAGGALAARLSGSKSANPAKGQGKGSELGGRTLRQPRKR